MTMIEMILINDGNYNNSTKVSKQNEPLQYMQNTTINVGPV